MNWNWRTTFALAMICFSAAALAAAAPQGGNTVLSPGRTAPVFSLQDMQGRNYALSEIKGRQMTVLYFFDAASSSSQEGLLMLDRLLEKYGDRQLSVWGITRSPKEAAAQFAQKVRLQFPILLDSAGISSTYGVGPVLPVVCTVGPGLEILDYFQGGGKSAEVMLVRLAERQIHRGRPQLARAIAAAAAEKYPSSTEAKAIEGYAALSEGRTEEAKQLFDRLAAGPEQQAVIGQEGQAAVLARLGKTDQALALADQLARRAPARSAAHKLKGDLLSAKGDRRQAAQAYEKAVQQGDAPAFLKAEAFNQLGRLYSQEGKYQEARSLFSQAVVMDPYYLEPTSNKGVAYEKEGQYSKALAEYRQVLSLDKSDPLAAVLARKAEQMVALSQGGDEKQRIDKLVAGLVERYKSQQARPAKQAEPADEWTSRPLVLSLVDIHESGGLAARDGMAIVVATRLGELLGASGRVRVVERVVLERLLSELNLGASELADPQTALKLGRLLAAQLIGTGSLLFLPDSTVLNLRLVDTETSAVVKTLTQRIAAPGELEHELFSANRAILKTMIEHYPLQGYVVRLEAGQAMINLGRNQGVTTGTAFDLIEPGESITYKGRVLQGESKTVGRLEVVRVAPDVCFARVIQAKRPPAGDDKVREVLTEVVSKGGGI